jgi:hypothetical protein
VLTLVKGIAVPPSPAPSVGLQYQNQASSTHITPVSRTPATDSVPFADVNPFEHGASATDRPQSAAETSPLPVVLDRDTARPLVVSAHRPCSNTTDDAADPGSDRLTPELGEAINGQYLGPSSAQSFLGKALRRIDPDPLQNSVTRREIHVETETSTLSFGDAKVRQPEISQFAWPGYNIATRLLEQFFEFASPTYRYMHEPTQKDWLEQIYNKTDVPLAAQACILLIFASASVFTVDRHGDIIDADHQGWESSEMYYQKAETLLSQETGLPRLESVQARFAAVQYLLSSSRPNKALITFGTMVQLMQMVGIHRKQSERAGVSGRDLITVEVYKRLFWCAFTLDKYLSIVMGRMPLLGVDYTNQTLPTIVDDEDLTSEGIRQQNSSHGRDCVLHATVSHIEIGLILARASQEQNRLPATTEYSHVQAAIRASQEIRDWHSKLIPILSGAVHPGILIPCFRRQQNILSLARLHAIMFVTRPLLLRDLSSDLPETERQQYRDHLRFCISAAKEAIEITNGSARHRALYPAFWFSQYIAFSAISIIHIYIIQLSRNRIPANLFDPTSFESPMHTKSLYDLALEGQRRLAEAGLKSAPVWRYSPILESLSVETGRYVASRVDDATSEIRKRIIRTTGASSNRTAEQDTGQANQESRNTSDQFAMPPLEMDMTWMSGYESVWDDLMTESIGNNNLTMDFWPQFDNLPMGML